MTQELVIDCTCVETGECTCDEMFCDCDCECVDCDVESVSDMCACGGNCWMQFYCWGNILKLDMFNYEYSSVLLWVI